MKKQLLTIAIVMPFISVGAYAHHPAADIVDPEIYAMIDENVSDTPHADLVFDDMGRDSSDTGRSMESNDDLGTENVARETTGQASADAQDPFEQTHNEDGAGDTIDMLDDVVSTLSD